MRLRLAAALLLCTASRAAADPIDRARMERARDAIFERREFTYDEAAGGSAIVDFMSAFADAVETLHDDYPIVFYTLIAVLVLALIVLLAHIVWTIRAARGAEFEGELDLDQYAELERAKSSTFRKRALEHARAGRFEAAVRDLYLALLLELDQRGSVRFASHKALLDYRLEARADPEARAALAAFGGTYLPTAFGRRPLDRAHFDELVAALDAVTAPEAAR